MKKKLTFALLMLSASAIYAQPLMQASIGTSTTSTNNAIIYIKPNALVSGTISTLAFDVAIPNTITPMPTMTIVGVGSFPISAGGWSITPPYIEGNFIHYELTTGSSPTVNIAANAETEVMEVSFTSPITNVISNVSLQSFGNGGGNNGNLIFFCSGAAYSFEGQLFYARSDAASPIVGNPSPNSVTNAASTTTVVNGLSYTTAANSSATLTPANVTPITWLSFNAIKKGNDAQLTWVVANDATNKYYEMQRSTDGIIFTSLSTIDKLSGVNNTYNYTDANITNLGAATLYYRIKQVDISGKINYSDVRLLKLDTKGGQINIFPNPVTKGFYVNMPLANPNSNSTVQLKLTGINGQVISAKQITALQATNYYFDISNQQLAAGNYNLQIITDGQITATKMLYVNQ